MSHTVPTTTLTMMGTPSVVPAVQLFHPPRRNAVRVRVKRSDTWVDITSRVHRGQVRHNNDDPVALLDLTLLNGVGFDSLAPRVKTSPMNRIIYPGSGTQEDPYIITTVEQLQAINENESAHYALGSDIDASATVNWDSGTGFEPIGSVGNAFTGSFDGRGYVIQGLRINRPNTDNVGLFGLVGIGGVVRRVGLVGASIVGKDHVGAVVGSNQGTVSQSYSMGAVDGNTIVGGLVGENVGTVSESYSTCAVDGSIFVGGLIGRSYEGSTVSTTYSAGSVLGSSFVGGLIGLSEHSVSQSYWDIETSGTSSSSGGVGKTTAEMMQQATFAGWDFGDVWNIDEENSYPALRVFDEPVAPPSDYAPLLDRYNEIMVEAAFTVDGSTDFQWVPVFLGLIGDETKTDHNAETGVVIHVQARDMAKQLQDDFITESIRYEDMYASQIVQALLAKRYADGHLPELITLNVVGQDDFYVEEVEFENISTWDAIQSFAEQSDKDIRYLWDEQTNQIRLTYWTPSLAMVPAWSIAASEIFRESLSTSDAGNRYRVVVEWRDSDGDLQRTVVQDLAARKPKEPIREMFIREADTSLIKDEGAALRFANAVLSATKNEPATDSLVLPFTPAMRLHDVVEVTNPDVRSEPELYAIEELRFNFTADDWSTEVVASETVKLRPEYWLSLDSRRGVNNPIPPEEIGGGNVVMPKPENVVVSAMEMGLSVHVPVPPVHANRWSVTEVYVSTTQGFTPSPATLVASNRSTHFPIGDLQPVPHYVRVLYRDINGKVSAFSDEYTATPVLITGGSLDPEIFAIEPESSPQPSSGSLENLWDMDETTGCEFSSAPTITFRYPVYQGSDLVEMHLQAPAQGYVQMRQRDTSAWVDILGSSASPVSFVAGWNRHRFTGNKMYFGREYRLVLLSNVRVNELRFERVTVADRILAGKVTLLSGMEIIGPDGNVVFNKDELRTTDAQGNYSSLSAGRLTFYDQSKGVQSFYINNMISGTAGDGEIIDVSQYGWQGMPHVLVAPASVVTTDPINAPDGVVVECYADVFEDSFRVNIKARAKGATQSGTTTGWIANQTGVVWTWTTPSGFDVTSIIVRTPFYVEPGGRWIVFQVEYSPYQQNDWTSMGRYQHISPWIVPVEGTETSGVSGLTPGRYDVRLRVLDVRNAQIRVSSSKAVGATYLDSSEFLAHYIAFDGAVANEEDDE